MDNRRLNTAQILVSGVLNKPALKAKCPEDALLADVDECEWSEESLRAGLEAGGLSGTMYYGCWEIWKTEAGFSGEFMQYCSVTDEFTDLPFDEALGKAEEWAAGCAG